MTKDEINLWYRHYEDNEEIAKATLDIRAHLYTQTYNPKVFYAFRNELSASYYLGDDII